MAKKKVALTPTYESYVKAQDIKSNKDTKEEYNLVCKIADDLKNSQTSRDTSCPLDEKGYLHLWEIQTKQVLRWAAPTSEADYKSNVKSSMASGRVSTIMQKLQRWDIKWMVSNPDKGKAKLKKLLMDHFSSTAEFKQALADWMNDALIHGSTPAKLTWKELRQDYSYPKTKKLTKDEASQVKEGKIIWEEQKDVLKFRGPVLEPVRNDEFFEDPQAREIHGNTYRCRFVIREKTISYEDFKAEYEKDPNIKNFDKVQPARNYSKVANYTMFLPPQDQEGEDVLLVEYENQDEDRYVLIANDIVIRDTPLPYNHKQVSYHKIDCIRMPHQFWHMGIPDQVRQDQTTDEITLNMILDAALRNIARKTIISSEGYGEWTRQMLEEDSQYISLKTNGQPISNMVYESQHIPLGNDIFRVLEINKQNATIATQIDPTQMAFQQPNRTATATATSSAIAEGAVNTIMQNFMQTGLSTLGYQLSKLIDQMLSIPEIKKIEGEDPKKEYYRIQLPGVKIYETEGQLEVEETDSEEYSDFEVKPEYLQTEYDSVIQVDPETTRIMDSSAKAQKAMEMYAQMMPNAVDPSDPMRVKMHPAPVYDIRKVAQMYVDANEADEDLLINQEKHIKQELKEAKIDIRLLMEGKTIASVPGRSAEHNLYEQRALEVLTARRKELEEKAKAAPVETDPMTMQPVPNAAQEKMMKEYEKLTEVEQAVMQHLAGDILPEVGSANLDIQRAAPQASQPGVPMPTSQPGGMSSQVDQSAQQQPVTAAPQEQMQGGMMNGMSGQ